jgi:hypothetical protein
MSSARIKGAKLSLLIGTPGVEYMGDLTAYKITNADADKGGLTTFEDAGNGGAKQFKLSGTAAQSTATGSFWRYVWANTGETAAFTVAPHGNETPTAEQPHFIGTVIIGAKPDLGVEAGTTNEGSFDFEWDMTGEPVIDEGSEV